MHWETLASGYQLCEGPTIDRDGSLLFSDVLGGGVYRLTRDGRVATVVPKRRGVGGIALHADGGIVCSGRDVVHIATGGTTRTILHVDGVAGWNDIATDESGRVYAGALRFAVFDPDATEVPGELWDVDTEGPSVVFDNVVHANGIALAPDALTIYMSDTRRRRVIIYDVEHATRRDVDVSAYGHPDGMALDESGCVWVALVSGGIGRLTPAGDLDRRIDTPSQFVTSVCFDGRDLYVTTGMPGTVLRTTVDVAGAPVAPARV
jgi:D-xylonolactonase